MRQKHDTFNIYDRVTELLREQEHPDPENATEYERFQCAVNKAVFGKKLSWNELTKGNGNAGTE